MTSLTRVCSSIEMLILDVDGVLTDGGIQYGDTGLELKTFHVRDGSGLKLWAQAGKKAGIITGRNSPLVDRRAKELDIASVVQGSSDKWQAFQGMIAEQNLKPEQVCYMGDDLPDVPVLRRAGLGVAVADACPEARSAARFVTAMPGGRGAVREIIEFILRAQGIWSKIVERYWRD